MPVVDALAQEFQGRLDVVAIAWQASFERTEAAARELLPSGAVRWTLDDDAFGPFEVTYQPVAVMATGGVEVQRWFGALGEAELRQAIEEVLA